MNLPIGRVLLTQSIGLMLPRQLRTVARRLLFATRHAPYVPMEWVQASLSPHDRPLVSVIIPCFNYGRFLPDAVASVRAQTLQDHEIIVVDDGSTDADTKRELGKLECSGITIIRQTNHGVSSARNAGLQIARGHYACCLDADDTLDPTYLEKCVLVLEANMGLSFAYSWLRVTGSEQRIWRSESLDLDRLRYHNHISVSAVFRRQIGLTLGGFCTEMREGYEDWEFWIRLAAAGHRGVVIPEPLVAYHRHTGSFMNRARARHVALVRQIYRRHRDVFDGSQTRRAIRQHYRDRLSTAPFANISRPQQYNQQRTAVILVIPPHPPIDPKHLTIQLLAVLGADYDLYVVASHVPAISDNGHVFQYTLGHLLPTHFHAQFVDHLVQTRMAAAVLWIEAPDFPEMPARTDPAPPFYAVLTTSISPQVSGNVLRLAAEPGGRLIDADRFIAALRPVRREAATTLPLEQH